jgi:transcriptional regulator with XRE-family HTH domain
VYRCVTAISATDCKPTEALLSSNTPQLFVGTLNPALPVVPFKTKLRQLREERGLSQEALARKTWAVAPQGISTQSIRFWETGVRSPGRSARKKTDLPARVIYELLAKALDVDPAEFPEYQLLVAREALDEQIVGLENAYTMLNVLLGAQTVPLPPDMPQPPPSKPRPSAKAPGKPRKARRQPRA